MYDDGVNVQLVTTDGRNRPALTNVSHGTCTQPRPSASGDQVVMICTADMTGTGHDTDGNGEVVLLNLLNPTPITSSPASFFNGDASISADGRTIVFTSNANYVGGNAAGNDALFLWHDDQLQLIAGGSGDCAYPTISADGQRILFKQSAPDGPGNDNNGFWPIQLYDIGSGRMSQVVSVESYDPQLSRDGQWVLFRSYADLAGSNPNGTGQLFAERVGGSVRQLTQIADRQTYFDFASNADASRIAAMLSRYDPSPPYTQSSEGLLFTSAGVGSLPGVPIDAQSLSFDAAGRLLAFISSQDPVRQNPQHVPQVFVAVIPLEVETPSPTSTPTPGSSMCVGDCDGSQAVTVDEILTMVNIALGNTDVSSCGAGDGNDDGSVTVDEIISAMNHALNGCS